MLPLYFHNKCLLLVGICYFMFLPIFKYYFNQIVIASTRFFTCIYTITELNTHASLILPYRC